MIQSRYQWQILNADQPSEMAIDLGKQLNVNPLISQILINRGYDNKDSMTRFLTPGPEQLHDPYELHDMDKAVNRLQQAIANDEKITVYGDYDADGVTSTAIMVEALNDLGANVDYYIPDRFTDGYGPNPEAFSRLIDGGTQLLVTVDNGVSGHAAIELAHQKNVDVVVTDHHDLPATLPKALAIVHPRNPAGDYPFGGLSGAGVAFKVATALLEEIPQDLLDLVAIGTVADLVPLVDENRVLVSFGLQLLRQDERPGLTAVMATAGIQPNNLTETSIGFGLAPRLNSLGRLGSAQPAVTLLTTLDDVEANDLAATTEKTNSQRQALVQEISDAALAIANDTDHQKAPILVISGQGWHEGVLGIVASKLVEKTGKPTIILTEETATGTAKGSGRSVPGFNLFQALDGYRDLFVAFGGHAMAVGLTVKSGKLSALTVALANEAVAQQLDPDNKPQIRVAAAIQVDKVTRDLYNDLQRLAPFGTDNAQPLFCLAGDTMADIQVMGKTKTHLKFKLGTGTNQVAAVAFGAGDWAPDLSANATGVQVLATIDDHEWQGRHSLQLMVRDCRQTGIAVVDARTSQLTVSLFKAPGTYVFFHDSLRTQLQGWLPDNAQIVDAGHLSNHERRQQPVFLVDCPDTLHDLATVLSVLQPVQVTAYLYKKQPVTSLGMPDRKQYAKLFKFVHEHQNVDIAHQLDQLAQFLAFDRTQLIFMIQVFFESGFISINRGVMNAVPHPNKKALSDAPSYQLREAQMAAEQALLATPSADFIQQLKSYLVE